MSVPLFTITPQIKQIAADAIDTLILQLGKPCKLVYPSVATPCVNCVVDTVNKRSMNVYKSGGPAPFDFGSCPLCGGAGYKQTEVSETITLLCNFNAKDWLSPNIFASNPELRLHVPDGLCLTKGFLTDLPKVQRASYAILATNDEPYLRFKYKIAGEPTDPSNIVQVRYFQAVWHRAG